MAIPFGATWGTLIERCEDLPDDATLITPLASKRFRITGIQEQRIIIEDVDSADSQPLQREQFEALAEHTREAVDGYELERLPPKAEPYAAVLALHPRYVLDERENTLTELDEADESAVLDDTPHLSMSAGADDEQGSEREEPDIDVYSALLARNGMEGPVDLFEGQKGWKQVIAGDFTVDLDPSCERVFDTMTKRYVAETYAQSAVEGVIELAEEADIDPEQVNSIHLDTFHGAKLIIGGGEGSRYEVETKAQADHSLPYMLAAALIDREMTNAAYDSERIQQEDVQELLRTVEVEEDDDLTERFEGGEMPAVIDIALADDSTRHVEKDAFNGHPTNPMTWEQIEEKFTTMTDERYEEERREEIVDVVENLEDHAVADLTALLD